MKFVEREFVPVVLGGDINTYSVARAFYEEYQIKTTVMGKFAAGPSYGSRIVDYIVNENIDQEQTYVEQITQFANDNKNKKIFILGAGDNYINMIAKTRHLVPNNVIVPFIPHDLMDDLQKKDYFYNLCDETGVFYPDTIVVTPEMGLDFEVDFPYPVILKSSESVLYWDYPFEGQDKVFMIDNRQELDETITKIFATGYPENLIIQDMIPGNDEQMYVLTSYSDQNGKVQMMCLGHTLLEEHTPTAIGNHAVIITDYDEELLTQARNFLESIHYVGFSNFDIKYDTRDGKYKFFEINTRQGRSNYYVTGSGFNIAKYLVDDYIHNVEKELEIAKEPHLWWVVPPMVAYKHVKEEKNLKLMKQLVAEGKAVNPLFFKPDLPLPRLARISKTYFSHIVKFNKYYK